MADGKHAATGAQGAHTWEADHRPAGTHEASTADLVKLVSEQTSRLVREELRLAQMELKDKGRHAGLGAGMFGGAGLISVLGLMTLIAAAVLGLAVAIPAWGAALVVAAILLVVAAVMGVVGRGQIRHAAPAKPEEATEGVRHDVETVKRSAHR